MTIAVVDIAKKFMALLFYIERDNNTTNTA